MFFCQAAPEDAVPEKVSHYVFAPPSPTPGSTKRYNAQFTEMLLHVAQKALVGEQRILICSPPMLEN